MHDDLHRRIDEAHAAWEKTPAMRPDDNAPRGPEPRRRRAVRRPLPNARASSTRQAPALTLQQVAEDRFQVDVAVVQQLVDDGLLFVLMVGHEPRITEREVARFMDENEGPWPGTNIREPR
jgi:hypothetical protein